MATEPSNTDILAQTLNGFLEALITGGEEAGEAFLTSLVPAFGLPVIKQLLDFGVSEIANVLYGFIAKSITAITIDLQTNGEKSAVLGASTALQIAIASGNVNAIQQAQTAAVQAWANLIHWDGSVTND
jgi:hypothetical protein